LPTVSIYHGGGQPLATALGTRTTPAFATYVAPTADDYQVAIYPQQSSSSGLFVLETTCTSTCSLPIIGSQPAGNTINHGMPYTFSVQALGVPPFSYRWYEGSSPDTSRPIGTDGPILVIDHVLGPQTVWVRVSNACGSLDSVAATVNVTPSSIPKRRASKH
jgi:hypothetical protein